jgi:hypothetical protein
MRSADIVDIINTLGMEVATEIQKVSDTQHITKEEVLAANPMLAGQLIILNRLAMRINSL